MDKVSLSTKARSKELSARQLRKTGQVPCIVYGNFENTLLQCSEVTLKQAYMKAGASTLVSLDVGGKEVPVLFHEITVDPVSSQFAHVDFYAVDMNKEVEAEVALHFEGEAPAVKDGGILVTPLTHLKIKCLPKDLPHNLPVDLSVLAEMHAVITVKDIPVPAGVTVEQDADAVVATIQEPRKEEEVVAPVAAEGEAGAVAVAEGAPTEGAPGAKDEKDKK